MLPGYADCSRRAAAKQFPDLISEAGFDTREIRPSIGAAVGTATHTVAGHILKEKIKSGVLGEIDEAVKIALAKLQEQIAPGCEWDDTTPNLGTAAEQLPRMVRAYLPRARELDPVAVEMKFEARVGDGWEMSGTVDLLCADGHLDDLKTGAVRRAYQAQLGGYAILLRANGRQVTSIGTTYVPRGKKTKPQPPPEVQTYDLDASERAAWTAIEAIKRDYAAFEKTGNPESFMANPMSMNCSPRYCSAWGTKFCRQHLPEAPTHNMDLE
jgi:hypothetical protein